MKAQRKDKTTNEAVLVTRDDFAVVCDSYSADRISDGRPIKPPFDMYGHRYIGVSVHGSNEAHAYRLMPIQEFVTHFKAIPVTYQQKVFQSWGDGDEFEDPGKAAREDPLGFYHGMRVKQGREEYVMTGPEVRFQAVEEKGQ